MNEPHPKSFRKPLFARVLMVLLAALGGTSAACNFHRVDGEPPDPVQEVHDILNKAPKRKLREGNRWTVFEDPGRIRVQHGWGCFDVGFASTETYIGFRIRDEEVAPKGTDQGAVFLNGWDLTYMDGDHNVEGLGTAIYNITNVLDDLGQHTLRWEAGGVLADMDGDAPYDWCYRYTLVFWSSQAFAAAPFQSDVPPYLNTFHGTTPGTETALTNIPATFHSDGGAPRALLPRGFGQTSSGWDHHVLQVGFDLGTPPVGDIIVPHGLELDWTSQAILKDNDSYFHSHSEELVTVLTGEGVEMFQPRQVRRLSDAPPGGVLEPTQFGLQPADGCDSLFCGGPPGIEEVTEEYAIENLPYEFAVPVLTAWNLQYEATDHHVERVGVFLADFNYVKQPNATTGTLRYTIFSTLRDDADNGLDHPKYKVSVLGMKGAGGGQGGRPVPPPLPPPLPPVLPRR